MWRFGLEGNRLEIWLFYTRAPTKTYIFFGGALLRWLEIYDRNIYACVGVRGFIDILCIYLFFDHMFVLDGVLINRNWAPNGGFRLRANGCNTVSSVEYIVLVEKIIFFICKSSNLNVVYAYESKFEPHCYIEYRRVN